MRSDGADAPTGHSFPELNQDDDEAVLGDPGGDGDELEAPLRTSLDPDENSDDAEVVDDVRLTPAEAGNETPMAPTRQTIEDDGQSSVHRDSLKRSSIILEQDQITETSQPVPSSNVPSAVTIQIFSADLADGAQQIPTSTESMNDGGQADSVEQPIDAPVAPTGIIVTNVAQTSDSVSIQINESTVERNADIAVASNACGNSKLENVAPESPGPDAIFTTPKVAPANLLPRPRGKDPRHRAGRSFDSGRALSIAEPVLSPLSPTPPVSSLHQLKVLLHRNSTLQLRHWITTLSQTILAPILFLFLLWILQQADYAKQLVEIRHPAEAPLGGVTRCSGGRGPKGGCVTIMYAPPTSVPQGTVPGGIYSSSMYDDIMRLFAENNGKRVGGDVLRIESAINDPSFLPDQALGIVPIPSADFLYSYLLANPNMTTWGIIFSATDEQVVNIQYQIWYNSTLLSNGTDIFGRDIVAFVRGIDEAIITKLNDLPGVTANIDVTIRDWPVIPASVLSDTIVQSVGPVFFFCSVMIIFITVLNQIVTEKELKLRQAMEMMGMRRMIYWLSHAISSSVLVIVSALTTSLFGLAFRFSAFVNSNFGVIFITFFMFGEAMIFFAFFVTTVVRNSRVAVLVGMLVFIIGLLFESFVFSNSFVGYIWWARDTTPLARYVLMFLPFFNFGKLFLDITTFTTGKLDQLTSTFIPGPGFPWSSLTSPIPDTLRPTYGSGVVPNVAPPVESIYFLIMNCVFYSILTLYLDNIIPDEHGSALPPWFLFTPSYWTNTSTMANADAHLTVRKWLLLEISRKLERKVSEFNTDDMDDANEDPDVHDERLWCLDETNNNTCCVRIVNLRKVYWERTKGSKKVAVKNLCMSLEEGKLIGLLGQNGAGKSTTINILSGLTPATCGDALMYGLSVRTQMHRIRQLLGVCPQHDILFDDLTAREHLLLYAGIKGVDPKVDERLIAVGLLRVRDQLCGTYSGGMKRRLSLLIATIGDPKILFLDEPTTGMDPVNRRHVWSFIESLKPGRVIVLTTHSMEEADVLGDRIAIMSHGRMRAIGTSLSLKTKYGAGYRVSVVPETNDETGRRKLIAEVTRRVPSAKMECVDSTTGHLIYLFNQVKKENEAPNITGDGTGSSATSSDVRLVPQFIKLLESLKMETDNDEDDADKDKSKLNADADAVVPSNENIDETAGEIRQRKRGKLVSSWSVSQTTLEEVFLKLIKDANKDESRNSEERKRREEEKKRIKRAFKWKKIV